MQIANVAHSLLKMTDIQRDQLANLPQSQQFPLQLHTCPSFHSHIGALLMRRGMSRKS